jgi:hypothetical protein
LSTAICGGRGSIPGYCIAVWKQGHIAEPTEPADAAAAGFWLEVLRLGRALEMVYRPAKMNYQTLEMWCRTCILIWCLGPWTDPAPHALLPWSYVDDGLQPDDILVPAARRLRVAL